MRRVYRTRNSLRIFSCVFLALSLFFVLGGLKEISASASTWLTFGIDLLLVLVGALFVARTFTASVVLSDDSIRHGSIFGARSMHFDEIRYRREYEEYQGGSEGGTNVSYLEFIPNEIEARSLKISTDDYDFDRAFWEWVIRIPSL